LADRDAVRQCAVHFRASFQGRVRDCLWATREKVPQDVRRERQMLQLDAQLRPGFQPRLSDAGPKAQKESVAARSRLHLADPRVRADESV
jgi:hypothetical protein